MPVDTCFYFEIHEDVGLAKDAKGNAVKAYIFVKLGFEKPLEKELYDSTHKELASYLANTELGILPEHIRPIDNAYYDMQTGEDVAHGLPQ